MKLRIATWNIGEDTRNEKDIVNLESYNYIKEMIEKLDIDILCLQEAITSSSFIEPISEYIINNTDLKYALDLECSPSHINIGSMMGIAICSKHKINSKDILMFTNPNIEYKKSETVTYKMHDKGVIVANIDLPLKVINLHGMPFFAFKREAKEFLYLYKELEEKIIKLIKNNEKFIFIGDINHTNFEEIFPKISEITNSNINDFTYIHSNNEKMHLDYIMTSKNIKVYGSEIIDNVFDHKLCITDVEI